MLSNDNSVNNNPDATIKKMAVNLIDIHEYSNENKDNNGNSSSNDNNKSSISLEQNRSCKKLPSFTQQSPISVYNSDNHSDSPFRNEDNKNEMVKFYEQKSFGKSKFIK